MGWPAVVAFALLLSGPATFPEPSDRILRLEAWLRAVDAHKPGAPDEPAQTIAAWSNAEIKLLWIDAQTLVRFGRCPLCKNVDLRARATRVVQYTVVDLKRLRELAASLNERKSDINVLIKRGAVMHADLAMLIDPAEPEAARHSPPERVIVFGSDGRQVNLVNAALHWEMGRALLDLVAPDGHTPAPGEDATVRLWYLATMAFLQEHAQHDPAHFARALELFPGDAEIQFQNGCLHETLASPRVQEMMRSLAVPSGMRFEIRSPREELQTAERLFRRAMELNQHPVEPRLRLGRVLGLLGRHGEAAELLRKIAPIAGEGLDYYASLFLGGEEEALGRRPDAQAAYERAARLHPRAQAPRLALSQLARRSGDRAAAIRALEPLLALSPLETERLDPWWIYHFVEGREADTLLDELYQSFRRAEGR